MSTVFSPWKYVRVGEILGSQNTFDKLSKVGVSVTNTALKAMQQLAYSPKIVSVGVVKVSLRRLGFTEPRKLKDIITRAEKLELYPLPGYIYPILRLNYATQHAAERLYCAMETIKVPWGKTYIFLLTSGYSARVKLDVWESTFEWSSESIFLFGNEKHSELCS